MRKPLIAFLFSLALLAGSFNYCMGQVAPTNAADSSLGISKGMLKLFKSLTLDFKDIKGKLVLQTEDSTKFFEASNINGMQAQSEYVVLKPNGSLYYVATYAGLHSAGMTLAAFTEGVIAVRHSDGGIKVKQDMEKSVDGKLVYYMTVTDERVACYTYDKTDKVGTLLIGWLQ